MIGFDFFPVFRIGLGLGNGQIVGQAERLGADPAENYELGLAIFTPVALEKWFRRRGHELQALHYVHHFVLVNPLVRSADCDREHAVGPAADTCSQRRVSLEGQHAVAQ